MNVEEYLDFIGPSEMPKYLNIRIGNAFKECEAPQDSLRLMNQRTKSEVRFERGTESFYIKKRIILNDHSLESARKAGHRFHQD